MTYGNMGLVHASIGDLPKALECHNCDLNIKLKVFGPDHLEPAKTKVNIANVLQQQGELQQALDKYHEALPVLEKTLGRNHLDVATTKSKYADPFCLHFF